MVGVSAIAAPTLVAGGATGVYCAITICLQDQKTDNKQKSDIWVILIFL